VGEERIIMINFTYDRHSFLFIRNSDMDWINACIRGNRFYLKLYLKASFFYFAFCSDYLSLLSLLYSVQFFFSINK
jgi:hypothetical protein